MLLLTSFLLTLYITKVSALYHLYNTNRLNDTHGDLQYDCLDYFVRDNTVEYIKTTGFVYQIIQYCIRPVQTKDKTKMKDNEITTGVPITFQALYELNVTKKQLMRWSASIDLVERFAAGDVFSLEIFYNCTFPWFGDYCQYSFGSSMWSFSDIVNDTFVSKRPGELSPTGYTNLTCYIHLQCYRGPDPMCLDWREICDGQVDCLIGGQDEQNCFQIEMNECADDEFRCHNGMCIPDVFFDDDELNPDCMDGTDEIERSSYTSLCFQDPAFRCSERVSSYHGGFSCGDDGFRSTLTIPEAERKCRNERDHLFSKAMWSYSNHKHSLSLSCWLILICTQNLDGIVEIDCDDICEQDTCLELIEGDCPPYFFFPNYPIFGQLHLLYFTNDTRYDSTLIPNYVCYNETLCDFLPSSKLHDNLTCTHIEQLGLDEKTITVWASLLNTFEVIFSGCSATHSPKPWNDCQSANLYRCKNSSKCISKHRLMDGVKDCYQGIDEIVGNSCQIDAKHRFHCSRTNQCIPAHLVLNGRKDCIDGEDEILKHRDNVKVDLSFTSVCDGFVDSVEIVSDNKQIQTDETNCEHWQCDNHYTHCDGVWNCPNGADEVACEPSSCQPNHHQCASAVTYQPICLPLARVGDGIVDCLGSHDERFFCREKMPNHPTVRYRCRNSTDCTNVKTMCKFPPYCFHDMKNNICSIIYRDAGNIFKSLTDEKRSKKYFSLPSKINFTNSSPQQMASSRSKDIAQQTHSLTKPDFGLRRAWLCNRGVLIYVKRSREEHCLCPPSHYGHRCQYQNERVSLTIQFKRENAYHLSGKVFRFIIMLIDDEREIHSHDQIQYIPLRDCLFKYNLNLVYSTRPKDQSKNFSVHIDGFIIHPLLYHMSWHLTIPFQFLPVNRLAAVLNIPLRPSLISDRCLFKCHHGLCYQYENKKEHFCRCHSGWRGIRCDIAITCRCAPNAICVGTCNNRSICVCPLEKFGSRCFLERTICQTKPCQNSGQCIPDDNRVTYNAFSCICLQGFSGDICQIIETKIAIQFHAVPIPSSVFAHFITVHSNAHPSRRMMITRIPMDQQSTTLFTSTEFHLLFVEIERLFYLAAIQERYVPSVNISSVITPEDRCFSTDELFDVAVNSLSLLQRVKSYHLVCLQNTEMRCFYDDVYLCLCTAERYGNCFEFDHKRYYRCPVHNDYCQKRGECFQDKASCPSTLICICEECYFGSRCQLSTKGFGLSLDSILGYKVKPQTKVSKQSSTIQVSIIITTIMTAFGLINAVLSLITFRQKSLRDTGCGVYLFGSAVTSLITIILFELKFWLFIVSYIGLITNRSFLLLQCITVDFTLTAFLNMNTWLNACVAAERTLIVLKGVHFHKSRSKRAAKWILCLVVLLNLGINIHDPIYRQLIDDLEEHRTWCVVSHASPFDVFKSAMNIIHFLVPYGINLISALIIIATAARQRARSRTRQNYQEHLREQFHEHKHLLISPCALVLLAVPRLIIAFSSNCMKSARDPWLYLISYFVSFIPVTLTFVVFVLPSQTYRKELNNSIDFLKTSIRRHLFFHVKKRQRQSQ